MTLVAKNYCKKITFYSLVKEKNSKIKRNLKGDSFDNIIWLVNIIPKFFGFSLLEDKINPLFWIIHLSLIFYIYGVGIVVFLVYHAQGAVEFTKSYVNVSLLILISNNSYWFLINGRLIKSIITTARRNDELVSKHFEKKHKSLLSAIMTILQVFFGFNFLLEFTVYLRNKADIQNAYCITPCAGLEPLTQSPNREICIVMLCATEWLITFVDLNYQALLCLLIAHTSAMYHILSDEINQLNEMKKEGNEPEHAATTEADRIAFVKERLNSFITRHLLILKTIQILKDLYSMPIGVNIITDAVCIMLFFFLPCEEYVAFSPVLIYCILVFFLYCFLCQRLINASELFEKAVYSCGWENFELCEKRKIYNMLVSAQRPVELLAAYILPINIATFASACQAMCKFVTAVKF